MKLKRLLFAIFDAFLLTTAVLIWAIFDFVDYEFVYLHLVRDISLKFITSSDQQPRTVLLMAEADKLNIDSIIARLLEGK